MTPRFIDDILKSDWLWHASRLLIAFMYWYAGIGFALDFQGAQQAMASAGIQPLWLVAALTILVEIGGSLLIIVGIEVMALGLIARTYGMYFMGVHDPFLERMRNRFKLEHGLLVGGAIIWFTIDTSTVMPRSLNDPECDVPHCLTRTSPRPSSRAR